MFYRITEVVEVAFNLLLVYHQQRQLMLLKRLVNEGVLVGCGEVTFACVKTSVRE